MITLQQALEKYDEQFPNYCPNSILDVGDEWVIAARSKKTGEMPDIAPMAISKEDGSMRMFIPFMNKDKLINAVIIKQAEEI